MENNINNNDYYCLNCLHSFRTENKLRQHINNCKKHDYCYMEIPEKIREIC